jgi:D-sedoheptulose 7-phosphate isomerase
MNSIKAQLEESLQVLTAFVGNPDSIGAIRHAGDLMVQALQKGNKIIASGNGGSMSDAMHFAEELTGRFRENRKPLAALAISDPSHITCVGNDFGFDHIFSRYVDAHGKPGDILLAISTSGNSSNILQAVASARRNNMKVVALTGKTGGKLASQADAEVRAPQSDYADRVQDIHIKVIHILIHYIENQLIL